MQRRRALYFTALKTIDDGNPKELKDIKQFIQISQRRDASQARIKKIPPKTANGKTRTKFKVRCSRYLYTLSLDDPEKAEKLKQSLPPGLSIEEVGKPKKK
ncbi:60S ribosomal protein L38-1 [Leucoagaricus sp. SymC.cos]|nr:60S ribosomal protein L38-1 [Leucoagaricus sp. SymC.cos]